METGAGGFPWSTSYATSLPVAGPFRAWYLFRALQSTRYAVPFDVVLLSMVLAASFRASWQMDRTRRLRAGLGCFPVARGHGGHVGLVGSAAALCSHFRGSLKKVASN